jgi:NADH:ubiquinone oxidoreductase subunit D
MNVLQDQQSNYNFVKSTGVLATLTYKDRIDIVVSKGFTKDEAYTMSSEQLIGWTDPIEFPDPIDYDDIPF